MPWSKRIFYIILAILVMFSIFNISHITGLLFNKASAKSNSSSIHNDNIKTLAYDDEFAVLSCDNNSTYITFIDKSGNEKSNPRIGSGHYIACDSLNENLFIVFNQDNKFKVLNYNLSFKYIDSSKAAEGNISCGEHFAFAKDKIFYVDNNKPSTLMLRSWANFESFDEINFNKNILLITCNPSKSRLYIKTVNEFKFLDISNGMLSDAGNIDANSFTFIDDNNIIADDGYIYTQNQDNTFYKNYFKGVTVNENISCPFNDGIITNMSDNLLYLLDKEDGTALKEFKTDNKILSICPCEPYVLILSQSPSNNIQYEVIKDFDPLQKRKYTSTTIYPTQDTINNLYKDLKPKNSSIDLIYNYKPDLSAYFSAGSITDSVLEDAINTVNFYRRSLLLSDLEIDKELCDDLQYTAALALYANDYSNPAKPQNMDDDFFNKAKENLALSIIDKSTAVSPTMLSNSINNMFNSNYSLRNLILSDSTTSIGFALVYDDSGNTAIAISSRNKNISFKGDNFISYPQNGYVPNKWVNNSSSLSIILNDDLIFCADGVKPTATIKNNTSQNSTKLSYGNGLSLCNGNKTIVLNYSFEASSTDSYTVCIDNIYDKDGISSYIEYNFNLFNLKNYDDDNNDNNNNDDNNDPEPIKGDLLTSDLYNIDPQTNIITGIDQGTTIKEFKDNILYNTEKYSIHFINYSNSAVTSGIVGTNMKVILKEKNKTKCEYTIVIYGDLTGEGNINSRDTNTLLNHLLGKTSLSGPYLLAADINHDNVVNTLDLLLLEKYIYDSIPVPQK